MSEDAQAILRYELYDACEEFTDAYHESDDKSIEGHLFGLLNATNQANDKLGDDRFMKIDEYLARYLVLTKPTPDQPDYAHFSGARVQGLSLGDKWATFCRSCRDYQEAVKFSEEVEASDEVREMLMEERSKTSLVRSIWHSTLPEEVRLHVPYKITEDTLSWFDAFPETPPSRDGLNHVKADAELDEAFLSVITYVSSYLPNTSMEDMVEIKAELERSAPQAGPGLDELLGSWDTAKRKAEWAEWVSERVASGDLEPSTS